jgi:hypothetical protein
MELTVGSLADRFRLDARNSLVVSAVETAVEWTRGDIVAVAPAGIQLPAAHQRWRCGGGCGNLTRFDVARSRRTTEFWHFDLAGEHAIEDTELRDEVVESVTCRWCGRTDAIELVDRAGADAQGSPGS